MSLTRYILSKYVDEALAQAVYDEVEDGAYAGRAPTCKGVVAFGDSLPRSTLEDWILLGFKLKHPLPVIAGIDINKGAVA